MVKYILLRTVWLFVILYLIITLLYFSTSIAQWRAWSIKVPFWDYMRMLHAEYLFYWRGIITAWDWGNARGSQTGVWDLLVQKAPHTLRINLIAFVVYMVLGILLGTLAAVKRNTLIDKVITIPSLVFGSIPNYIWVFLFMIFLGYRWNLLPPIPPSSEAGVIMRWKSYVIPVAALMLMPMAKFIALMRGEVIEALESDYILLLKTKGLTNSQIIYRHLIKDCLVPIMPEIAPTFGFVLTGSFLVERINNIPGVSKLLADALFSPMMDFHFINIDVRLAVMVCVFYIIFGLVMVLMVDLVYAVMDPRIKMGSKR
ncbi:MAG: ABC transporter permease [Acholeplasmatales bacterium]|nr:MAG: ABC transporter permease [Acholeplasmatales bacterium]